MAESTDSWKNSLAKAVSYASLLVEALTMVAAGGEAVKGIEQLNIDRLTTVLENVQARVSKVARKNGIAVSSLINRVERGQARAEKMLGFANGN
jgi:hypothetical protein